MSDGDLSIEWQTPAPGPRPIVDGGMRSKILAIVADDNAEVLHATSDLIADYGIEIVSLASNVEEAVDAAGGQKPDLAFIDAFLLGGGAEAAAQRIKSVSPATSVVVLASVRHLELDLKMRAAGAHGCYEKEMLSSVLPEILASMRRH